MTTRRNDRHAALTDAVTRRESDWVDADGNWAHGEPARSTTTTAACCTTWPRWTGAARSVSSCGVGALAALVGCSTGTGTTATGSSSSTTSSGTSGSDAAAVDDLRERRRHAHRGARRDGAGRTPATGATASNVLDDSGIVRQTSGRRFGTSTTTAAGRAADRQPHRPRLLDRGTAATGGRRGLRVARRRARASYSMYSRGVDRTRTTCAASSRPTRLGHGDLHDDLPGVLRRAAGRTSTSRSTAARRGDERRARSSRPARSRCRRRPATPVYATDGYPSSVRNLSQVSLTARQRLRRRRRHPPDRDDVRQHLVRLHLGVDRRGVTTGTCGWVVA